MTENCITLKLINGDELVGILNKEDKQALYIKDCLIIKYVALPYEMNSKVVLLSYLPQSEKLEDGLKFKKSHVITYAHVSEDFQEFYTRSLKYLYLDKSSNYSSDSIESLDNGYIYKNSSKAVH